MKPNLYKKRNQFSSRSLVKLQALKMTKQKGKSSDKLLLLALDRSDFSLSLLYAQICRFRQKMYLLF